MTAAIGFRGFSIPLLSRRSHAVGRRLPRTGTATPTSRLRSSPGNRGRAAELHRRRGVHRRRRFYEDAAKEVVFLQSLLRIAKKRSRRGAHVAGSTFRRAGHSSLVFLTSQSSTRWLRFHEPFWGSFGRVRWPRRRNVRRLRFEAECADATCQRRMRGLVRAGRHKGVG